MRATRHGCRGAVAVAVLSIAVMLMPCAGAWADVEPNDHLLQSEPVTTDGPITGSVSDSDGRDQYLLYVSGRTTLDIAISADGVTGTNCARVWLTGADGAPALTEIYLSTAPQHLRHSNPGGVHRYFLYVFHDCGDAFNYTFTVSHPGARLVSEPPFAPIAITVPTPNQTVQDAFGPLNGGVIYGESDADVHDWLYFYAAPGRHRIDVTVVGPPGCDVLVDVRAAGNYGVGAGVDAYPEQFNHAHFISPDAARYVIETQDGHRLCPPDSQWRLQIDPASAVTPSLKRSACSLARERVRRRSLQLRRDRHALAHATGARRPGAARRLAHARRAYRVALRQRHAACLHH